MNTPDKPKGYTKYILAFDTETTGLSFGKFLSPEIDHQILSIGIVIVDSITFEKIEDLYLEIKWNKHSIAQRKKDPDFGKGAERIHGLTRSYLDKNGVDEEEAVTQIVNLIMKYWGPTVSIKSLGHNVHTFDIPFLHAMCLRHGITLRWGNRHIDTFSLSVATFGSWNSDDMFDTIGLKPRDAHNALHDIEMTLDVVRTINVLWNKKVGLKSYE